MSEIVSKFYSPCEKIGIMKHCVSKEETDFLDEHDKFEQFRLLDEEDLYNIRRVKIKFHLTLGLAILILIAGLSVLLLNWHITVTMVLLSLIPFIISKHLHTRLDILLIGRAMMRAARQCNIEDMVR